MSALKVDALSKSFGGLRVTADVSLTVEPGERRLIIGPNGAGKTTLFNLITGELTPDSGSILLFDHDITRIPSRRRAHLGMARTYQIITLFPLAQVGLTHIADRQLSQTSYGEQRRVEIAMAMAQNPKVLLLDEPFAGLSIDERRDVSRLLSAIPREVTVVMIEHDIDTALELADRITLLHFGEVIVEGTRAEVVADPRTKEIYLGA